MPKWIMLMVINTGKAEKPSELVWNKNVSLPTNFKLKKVKR
jgi:hypothetical protein